MRHATGAPHAQWPGYAPHSQWPGDAPHSQWTLATEFRAGQMQRADPFNAVNVSNAVRGNENDPPDSASTVFAFSSIGDIGLECNETMEGAGLSRSYEHRAEHRFHRYSKSSDLLREISRRHCFSATCTALAEILLEAWLDANEEELDVNALPSEVTIATCMTLAFKWLMEEAKRTELWHVHKYPEKDFFSAIWLVVVGSRDLGAHAVQRMHAKNQLNGTCDKMRFVEMRILRVIDWNFRQFDDEVDRRVIAQENSTACPARFGMP